MLASRWEREREKEERLFQVSDHRFNLEGLRPHVVKTSKPHLELSSWDGTGALTDGFRKTIRIVERIVNLSSVIRWAYSACGQERPVTVWVKSEEWASSFGLQGTFLGAQIRRWSLWAQNHRLKAQQRRWWWGSLGWPIRRWICTVRCSGWRAGLRTGLTGKDEGWLWTAMTVCVWHGLWVRWWPPFQVRS